MSHRRTRAFAIASASLMGAFTLVLGGSFVASAHVGVSASTTDEGSNALLTFSVPHGCDGSATTGIAIRIPEGIDSVTPEIRAGWTVEKIFQDLDTPTADSHGNALSQRVSEIVYTADTPLPDGYREAFVIQARIPAGAAGTELVFPVVQSCEQGEAAWIQTPTEGQDPHDLAAPAPSFTVTAAPSGHGNDHGADDAVQTADSDSSGNQALSVIALVGGILGLLTGGAALLRSRKRA